MHCFVDVDTDLARFAQRVSPRWHHHYKHTVRTSHHRSRVTRKSMIESRMSDSKWSFGLRFWTGFKSHIFYTKLGYNIANSHSGSKHQVRTHKAGESGPLTARELRHEITATTATTAASSISCSSNAKGGVIQLC